MARLKTELGKAALGAGSLHTAKPERLRRHNECFYIRKSSQYFSEALTCQCRFLMPIFGLAARKGIKRPRQPSGHRDCNINKHLRHKAQLGNLRSADEDGNGRASVGSDTNNRADNAHNAIERDR